MTLSLQSVVYAHSAKLRMKQMAKIIQISTSFDCVIITNNTNVRHQIYPLHATRSLSQPVDYRKILTNLCRNSSACSVA